MLVFSIVKLREFVFECITVLKLILMRLNVMVLIISRDILIINVINNLKI